MYIVVIIVGFLLIGAGVTMWLEDHVVEKWQQGMSTTAFYDADGNMYYKHFDESFYKEYKIVKKEKEKK